MLRLALVSPFLTRLANVYLSRELCSYTTEAQMYACVYYKVDPETPFDVYFTAGASGDKCMTQRGSNGSMKVTSKGVTCASLGVVESDTDRTCYWKSSFWGTSYVANGISGATNSQWSDNYSDAYIELQDASSGTNVCASKANCQASKQRWTYDTKSDIYVTHPTASRLIANFSRIVFQPEFSSTSVPFTPQKPDM